MKDFCIALYTISLLLIEYICYLCGKQSNVCLHSILHKLAHINVLYIKVIQALSTRENLLTLEQLDSISHYTDNVPYSTEDIDEEFKPYLTNHVEQPITLSNNGFPIQSGNRSISV